MNIPLVNRSLYSMQESEKLNLAQLELVIKAAGIGVWDWQVKTGEFLLNDGSTEMFGYNLKELQPVKFDKLAKYIHPDDYNTVSYMLEKHFQKATKLFEAEVRIKHKEGQYVWVLITGKVIEWYGDSDVNANANVNGIPKRMIGIHQCMKDRKFNNQNITTINNLLDESQKIAKVGGWQLDLESNHLFWTSETYRIHETSPEEFNPTVEAGINYFLPASKRIITQSLDAAINQGKGYDLELETYTTKGKLINIRTTCSVTIKDGKPIKLTGIFQDITAEKSIQRALKNSVQELESSQTLIKTLLNTIPDMIWLKDNAGVYITCNSKFERMFGAKENEIVGKTDFDFVDKNLASFFTKNDQNAILAGQPTINDELLTFADDGHTEFVETIKTPMIDNNGNAIGVLGIARDVTNYKNSLAQLRESESKLKEAQNYAKIGYWELLSDKKTAYWSQEMYTLFGLDQTYKAGPETLCNVMNKSDFPTFINSVETSLATDHEHHVEYRITRPSDGEKRWIECRGKIVIDSKTKTKKISGFIQDITERKQSEEKIKLAASVFTHARESIAITNADALIIEVNDTFTQTTGYSLEESIGKNPRFLQSGRQPPEFYVNMWQILLKKGYWSGEIWNRRKNGEIYAEFKTISSVRDKSGNITHYVALGYDITPMKEHQAQLERNAHYDLLTNLPNRVLLSDRLSQAMLQCDRHDKSLAVVFLDLDGFKTVNDTYGHDIGDELLIALSARMKIALRQGDNLARIGGDEFVAVLTDLSTVEDCEPILERLLLAASEPVTIDNIVLNISASIGVTIYPQDNVSADQLMRHADQAMYAAKDAGKNQYHLFDTAQDDAVKMQRESLEAIRNALDNQQFVLYYQPKVNMRTGTVKGTEALIRWQHPERGLLNPMEFLPVIENNPMMIELGEWVINTALSQMSQWQAMGLTLPLSTSVNIAAVQLQQPNFTQRLTTILAAHPDVQPHCLELEVLETSALDDVHNVSKTMNDCIALGVSFALDDFGTGYSSLTYIRRLPTNLIKIDQSFVRDMLDDIDDLAIVEGVIGLAKSFKRDVIAEGVETIEHGTALLQLGCELAQGYGIAKPMPACDIPNWARNWKPDINW